MTRSGTWPRAVKHSDDGTHFTVDDQKISFSDKEDFTQVDWKSMGVQIVIDCTGKFLTARPHLPPPPVLAAPAQPRRPSRCSAARAPSRPQVAALQPYLDVCGVQRVVVSARTAGGKGRPFCPTAPPHRARLARPRDQAAPTHPGAQPR